MCVNADEKRVHVFRRFRAAELESALQIGILSERFRMRPVAYKNACLFALNLRFRNSRRFASDLSVYIISEQQDQHLQQAIALPLDLQHFQGGGAIENVERDHVRSAR